MDMDCKDYPFVKLADLWDCLHYRLNSFEMIGILQKILEGHLLDAKTFLCGANSTILGFIFSLQRHGLTELVV